MTTNYNILLNVKNINSELKSFEVEDKLKNIFQEANLLGQKHVNHIGKVYDGFDSKCGIHKLGSYGVFVRSKSEFKEKTMREIINYKKLVSSGFNMGLQKVFNLGEESLDVLENEEPLAGYLTYAMYYQLPHVESLSIDTIVGKQDTHVHTINGEAIQFWRPKNMNSIYDFDILKKYLFNSDFDFKTLTALQKWKKYEAHDLYQKIMHNPDSMGRSDFVKLWLIDKL